MLPTSVTATLLDSCWLFLSMLMWCFNLPFYRLTASNWISRMRIFLAAVSSVLVVTAVVLAAGTINCCGLSILAETRGLGVLDPAGRSSQNRMLVLLKLCSSIGLGIAVRWVRVVKEPS